MSKANNEGALTDLIQSTTAVVDLVTDKIVKTNHAAEIEIPALLRDWITKIEAQHVSMHRPKTAPQHRYDVWATRLSLFVTLSTASGGFRVFTASSSLNVDCFLADAEARLK